MNQLSWLLYLAELSESIAGMLWLLVLGGGVLTIIRFLAVGHYNEGHHREDRKPYLWRPRLSLTIAITVMLIAAALPSKNTVYAIAASQMGEQVLKTPLAGKAEQALEAWLNRQIKKD